MVASYRDQTWQLEPTDLGAFLTAKVEGTASGPVTVAVEADEVGLADWLAERFGPVVDVAPVDAVVGWNGERVVAIESSVNGSALDAHEFARAVVRSLLSDHAPVEIPIATVPPAVDSTNLSALGVTTRLAAGDSNYEGSNEGRATNLRIGANLLNGTLVPPGGAFAFNHAIGIIDEAKGYVDAPVIDGERIGRDIGGGVCQVSTTAFRAAFLAGLPIVEWWPHTYRLAFYERDGWEPGLDASILQPEGDPFGGGDFRFVNPTDAWLLVESWANATHVYVVLYGPDLGYRVEVSGPHYGATIPPDPDLEVVDPELPAGTVSHTELPVEGMEVTYTRDVYDREGTLVAREDFSTLYHSRGNVWRVSPDMAGRSPAGASGP